VIRRAPDERRGEVEACVDTWFWDLFLVSCFMVAFAVIVRFSVENEKAT